MPNALDNYLGILPASLKLRTQRTELLANNLANADTPNFKSRDLDFRSALAAATQTAGGKVSAESKVLMTATKAGHIGAGVDSAASNPHLMYRTPLAPSLDGNTVDAQLEQAAFAENSVRYQATLNFLSNKFRGLMTAITGQ